MTSKIEGSKEGGGEQEEDQLLLKVWDCGSPLYDSYELAWLDNVLDRHSMAFPFGGSNGQQLQCSRPKSTVIATTQVDHDQIKRSKESEGSPMAIGCFRRRSAKEEKEAKANKANSASYRICKNIGSWKKNSYKK